MNTLMLGILGLLVSTSLSTKTVLADAEKVDKPNILLVIADDMGIDASPCYDVGVNNPNMPNLSKMCSQGVVFDNFYTNPMCSPTRASMLTGRYSFRTGVGTAGGPRSSGLKLEERTLFHALSNRAPDYHHAVIGKWHLAYNDNGGKEHPSLAGVGYYTGVLSGTVDDYSSWTRTENGQTQTDNHYITTSLTDSAINWVRKQKDDPWFLWLAHVAPHTPFHLPPTGLYSYTSLSGSTRDIRQNPQDYYFAALEALDHEMGRLLSSMSKDVRDNTIVMFMGDNGTPNRSVQTPYERGRAKSSVYEGGTHTPLIVSGNGVDRKGVREHGLINSTDMFATIMDLAGIDLAKNSGHDIIGADDGISFAPLLNGKAREHQRSYAYVEHFNSNGGSTGSQNGNNRRAAHYGWAVRDERYKYVQLEQGGERLYDLQNDPYESTNILSSSAEIADRLRVLGHRLKSD
jgi:arylsulfatase A-like enzyme